MKRVLLVLFILMSFNLYGVDFNLLVPKEISLGEVVQTRLETKPSANLSQIKNLSDTTVEDSLYIVQMGTLLKQDNKISIDVSVIFTKKIDKTILSGKKDNFLFNLIIQDQYTLNETQPAKDSIMVDSNLQYLSKHKTLILIVLVVIALLSVIIFYVLKTRKKKSKKNFKDLKNTLYQAIEYDDIIGVWYKRDLVLKSFPQIKEKYKEFEKVLNLYQFAPVVSNMDKEKIIQAYQSFLVEIKGDLDGV